MSSTGPTFGPASEGRGYARRVAGFIARRHRGILLVTLLLVGLAAWRTSKLALRADLSDLLPARDPAVTVLHEMDKRMEALATVVVVVQSPDPAANQRFVDDLVPRLRALGNPEIADVDAGVGQELAFYRHNKFLYAGLDDLEDAYVRLRREILRRKNPAFVPLGDEQSLEEERDRIDKKERELTSKYPGGYYTTKDRHLYAVVVRINASVLGAGTAPAQRAAALIRRTALELEPRRYAPGMEVGLTGSVITSIAERKGLESDLAFATTVSVLLVCLVIFLFFGRLRAVPYAVFSALCGVTFALAFAQLAFGYLNSSTAFMGAIIVGNGINYAIIQMARYEEERRRGRPVVDAIAVALRTTWRATMIASLGAAVAYASLAITSFRGFNQFGYIGGVGMVLSWVVTVLALPSLWVLFDHRPANETAPRVRGFAAAAPLGRFAVRRAGLLLALGAVLSALSLVPLSRYVRDPFEYDFRKLRSQQSRASEAERLSRRLDPIFGRTLSPSFVLADSPAQVPEIVRQMRAKDERYHVLGEVRTIDDYLPGDPAAQRDKLEVLARIRRLLDRNMSLLDEGERADARELRPPDDLHVITPRDLPAHVRRFFTEKDGTIGRVVVYYARKDITIWDGHTLIKLAAVAQNVRLPSGETIRSSGPAVIFAAMIKAIVHDGPLVTVAAFFGVALLIVFLTRRVNGAWLILGVLCAGVLWMAGAAAWADVRINFLNFIALPITFGIGVDYAVNLYLRCRLEGSGRVARAIESTGGAVTLCSLTTIIGYGALLVAHNHALRSFGAMAILGEFACLAAALLVLPAALVKLEQRQTATERPPHEARMPQQ